KEHSGSMPGAIAYFSMEFGLSEALPIYSGGLGLLAGDHLKTASDLGVPIIGIGLLYQQGYFRQILSKEGAQIEAFPYNDPTTMPVIPARDRDGRWLRIELRLPGRTLFLRVWQACVGRADLYLLDSNDPLNNPWDRAITASLYSPQKERRLIQELVLGIGGWQVLEELGIDVDVCHMNEGHAAFVVLARAMSFMEKNGTSFQVALWATRAGNVFTTHTPVAAGFDSFDQSLMRQYAQRLADSLKISIDDLHLLGQSLGFGDGGFEGVPLVMANLAIRGSCFVNGVSRLHGRVSRGIFQSLYPRWPRDEVPVGHITNGVHIPTWDSEPAFCLWSKACGEDYWKEASIDRLEAVSNLSDPELWTFREESRRSLIEYVRRRLVCQLKEHNEPQEIIDRAYHILDPKALTIGFARRFAAYKRPTLMLHDIERLSRILLSSKNPVQIIVAGKAHPEDLEGKRMVQEMARFASRPELFGRVVFLEDYDIALAQKLESGIDVWINNPRRPMEACGTSGMKVLVNGGLNLSELDGWWDEAYTPDVGWALGDGQEHDGPGWDACEADQMYGLIEGEIVPEFYDRDSNGLPERWISRVRASMTRLTPEFSSFRMMKEYVEKAYIPASEAYHRRTKNGARIASELVSWHEKLARGWSSMRFGEMRVERDGESWTFQVHVQMGEIDPEMVRVELYADALGDEGPTRVAMINAGTRPGAVNDHIFTARVCSDRPSNHYTPRIVPYHPESFVPIEDVHILWLK
ncbi:MAG TPA: alpha-glucan family phosphorylase, partial [Methanotrichaceae archaeon]|nr:alpha-glucan family phosphorylase [Methanotrichaceae archaeon]